MNPNAPSTTQFPVHTGGPEPQFFRKQNELRVITPLVFHSRMLGEGFDDAWVPPSRPARPVYFAIASLEDAVWCSSKTSVESLRASISASAGSPWVTLLNEALTLAALVVEGRYADAVHCPTGQAILGRADEFEAADTDLADMSSVTALLRKRVLRYLDAYDIDEYSDAPGSTDTPRTYRAFCISLVAAALLNLFVQVRL